MKKIAFISSGHTGSLLPLIKRFLEFGYYVDLYLFIGHSIKDQEGFVCEYKRIRNGTICELSNIYWKSLDEYLQNDSFHLLCCGITGIPVFHRLGRVLTKFNIRKLCYFINNKHYDSINLVGRYNIPYYKIIVQYLQGNVVVSLHEVCNHCNPDYSSPNDFLKRLFKTEWPIIVHSSKTKKDLLKYNYIKEDRIHVIHFGLFESYLSIKPKDCFSDIGSDFVLFIGSVQQYKGLDVLYEAVSENKEMFQGVKFVVAGRGHVPVLDKMELDDSFICINKFLDNNELVELISRSRFVVCPYHSMSQSGIPQTAFVFNKPIIASNLDGFSGIVNDKKEGLLFQCGNSQDLAQKMWLLINNNDFFSTLVENLKSFEANNKDYSWDTIFNQYLNVLPGL